ncbi:hypothetical protein [Clostridium sp. ATCC 25772]|uniref:hypothetical protein n=1 Tax=Clostridium sp. ATCC 25772 TaxID=1676991 RepID=UPI0007831652|nr:hypothetical protein [Clostridium sp. ATCC 25772]
MVESKHDKFVRIAENRTNKIIDILRLLGNCSNKAVYEYSDADIKAIFNAIEFELRNTKNKFQDNELKENKFKLR